jgi:hypothetical protein
MAEQGDARRCGGAMLGDMEVTRGVVESFPRTLQFHSFMPGRDTPSRVYPTWSNLNRRTRASPSSDGIHNGLTT